MTWHAAHDPAPGAEPCPALDAVIVARARDLGGFEVRRALPSARRQMVGPFIFWDQMGPALFTPGRGIDVRPHPHIGLATVTYLFSGEILHRDSLGTVQPIRPGAVNWMSAGRGIAHSERTGPEIRAAGHALFGIQSWVALPEREEEGAPAFTHVPEAELPVLRDAGQEARVIAGRIWGAASPLRTPTETVYADVALAAGASVPFPATWEERAAYVAAGRVLCGGQSHGVGELLLFRPGDEITLSVARDAPEPARLLLFGGEPMDGPRHIWWNFVSARPERIEEAKAAWRAGRFDPVPGETEFIPLPESPAPQAPQGPDQTGG